MGNQPARPHVDAARFSPAAGIASLFRWFSRARRKYRTEWWILIAGVLVIGFIVVHDHLRRTSSRATARRTRRQAVR